MRRRASCSSAIRRASRAERRCCSRPAMAPRACRISAPSTKCCARRWCGSAFEALSDQPTRLIAFSDDMDGLRKVPDNVPNGEMLAEHLGKPLTRIPDPFGTHDSFAAHNNAMLRDFLDRFGFDYEFVSSTDYYAGGRFDEALQGVLRHYRRRSMDVMLPTLREERRATYSPVLPISPTSGIVLQVPVEVVDAEAGLIALRRRGRADHAVDPRRQGQAAVEGRLGDALGRARRRLRDVRQGPDRLGRPVGEDRARARRPPARGLQSTRCSSTRRARRSPSRRAMACRLEQWLTLWPRGEPRLLHLSRAQEGQAAPHGRDPARGGRILAVPRQLCRRRNSTQQLGNPVHHIHDGQVPEETLPVTFGLLLNLVGVMGDGDQGAGVGLSRQLRARRDAGSLSGARSADRLCARLCPRFRRADAPAPRARGRRRAAALRDSTRSSPGCRRMRPRRGHPEHRLRDRQDGGFGKEPARLVQGAVRDAARLRARGRGWAASSRSTGSTIPAA